MPLLRTTAKKPKIKAVKRLFCLVTALFVLDAPLAAYRITYAEEWYNLYHQHLYMYPEELADNLMYLEEALKANFSNPLYALAKINDETEWERYRYLFKLHVHLQIIRTYIQLAVKYDKQKAYFYNAPWKEQNLRSLDIAEKYYNRALFFWESSKEWVSKANNRHLRWVYFSETAQWHEELRRINEGELDFEKIIGRHLRNLAATRTAFNSMNENTY